LLELVGARRESACSLPLVKARSGWGSACQEQRALGRHGLAGAREDQTTVLAKAGCLDDERMRLHPPNRGQGARRSPGDDARLPPSDQILGLRTSADCTTV